MHGNTVFLANKLVWTSPLCSYKTGTVKEFIYCDILWENVLCRDMMNYTQRWRCSVFMSLFVEKTAYCFNKGGEHLIRVWTKPAKAKHNMERIKKKVNQSMKHIGCINIVSKQGGFVMFRWCFAQNHLDKLTKMKKEITQEREKRYLSSNVGMFFKVYDEGKTLIF